MSVRKNISLEKGHLRKLEPLVLKHKGNFSAAMREIIDLIDTMTRDPEAINNLIDGLKTDYNLTENVNFWLIKQARGRLIDPEHLNSIIDPAKIVLLSDLEKYMDDMTTGASWQTNIRIEDYDDNVNPSYLTLTLSGNSNYKLEFLGGLISSFLVLHKKQEIVSLKKMSNKITVSFRKQISTNHAKQSLINYFGDMEDLSTEISKKLDFWKCIVNLYKQTNYNMVTIPKNYYQELLIGKEAPSYLTAPIEAIHKIPIRDIPIDVLIPTMKSVYEYMGIVERIDINENTLYIYHGNTDKRAISAIEKILLNVLNSNGTMYESRCSENLIVMSPVLNKAQTIVAG
ncbi:MAG: hypothetical protein OIN86_04380 [Candidatus Methanoperedens sp.]|nr:hypothetical protein [Candidatus Methanoperedens sp.]CAG0995733.1 hypothetical protein METP1_02553 [Methanosarcinales archaeon]